MKPETLLSQKTNSFKKIAIIVLCGITLFAFACGDDSTSETPATTTSRLTGTIYVNVNSTAGDADGSSWTKAYSDLAWVLSNAGSGAQIYVAKGTYYPTSGTDRTQSFTLVAGVSVYGGFAGTESALSERDYQANTTILSGDIDRDGLLDSGNSYHVVTGADSAVLDGFTVTMGYAVVSGSTPSDFSSYNGVITVASGFENNEILRILTGVKYIAGGGMLNLQAAPTVRNCTFTNNKASKGGAVYNMVQRNYPQSASYDSATFENCVFSNNYATARGGAINNDMYTHPTFVSCVFNNNTSESKGGAIYNDLGCNPQIVNTLFYSNSAERGSAIVSDGSSIPSLLYVTIVNNTATDIGAALYQGTYGASGQVGGSESKSNYPKLIKCLVLGNTSAASSSSISNWMDCRLNTDSSSVVETTDGTLSKTTYFTNPAGNNYEPLIAYNTLGWSASRDTSNWQTEIAALRTRTYVTFPYSTTVSSGSTNTIYVDRSATGANNGSSWANAYTDLQSALAAATSGSTILVAQGTYYPTSGTNRAASFVVKNGITLRGGYPTGGGTQNVSGNVTILSGDIDDRNGTLDNGNSYHVVIGAPTATIDGFTITQGYADGEWYHQRGAGMLLYGSSTQSNNPTLSNCTFTNNKAVEGAGLACYNYGSPTIIDCTFSSNTAERGGALVCRAWSDPVISGTTFSSNTSTDRGGAVFIDYGAWPSFSGSCVFSSNSSNGYGGAVYIDDNAAQRPYTKPSFTSCSFNGNSTSAAYGGAMFGYNTSTFITISSCTFGNTTSNTSATAGADLGFRYLVDVTISGSSYGSLYKDSTVTLH